ncbi:MAG: DinB family protein [Lewinellaceae bacterium]|nr:DinB family protein [Saprospiraceae bacterium]MCB9338099.1 DinB family protein [Lewinellaceae bacterium]
MQDDLLRHFQHLLHQLKAEIAGYPDEKSLWQAPDGISNSAGNLCYHLCGNLNHFIGHGLGDTGYVRDRPLEFSIRDVPRAELIQWVEQTSDMLARVLPGVDLEADCQPGLWPEPMKVGDELLRLLWHLGYHLGQINYHRRLLT